MKKTIAVLPGDGVGPEVTKEAVKVLKKVAEKKLKEGFEGFNLVMNNFEAAGQVVKHFHLHIIPRKKDDNLKFFSK